MLNDLALASDWLHVLALQYQYIQAVLCQQQYIILYISSKVLDTFIKMNQDIPTKDAQQSYIQQPFASYSPFPHMQIHSMNRCEQLGTRDFGKSGTNSASSQSLNDDGPFLLERQKREGDTLFKLPNTDLISTLSQQLAHNSNSQMEKQTQILQNGITSSQNAPGQNWCRSAVVGSNLNAEQIFAQQLQIEKSAHYLKGFEETSGKVYSSENNASGCSTFTTKPEIMMSTQHITESCQMAISFDLKDMNQEWKALVDDFDGASNNSIHQSRIIASQQTIANLGPQSLPQIKKIQQLTEPHLFGWAGFSLSSNADWMRNAKQREVSALSGGVKHIQTRVDSLCPFFQLEDRTLAPDCAPLQLAWNSPVAKLTQDNAIKPAEVDESTLMQAAGNMCSQFKMPLPPNTTLRKTQCAD
ncbi:hypothetical protein FGO68_gene1332 [Halteria grandinella]|uniref:Uncharacterized protein n=1 Tax=Halteria grandinella TaxID=5974 RepID=A0A8J8P6F9_HALGN|nr:hypothetical protein FGO68_gene1332 [Halteria grandinella]